MDKSWTVVQFTDENTVEAVPSSWITNNRCYWPPISREKILTCIKKGDPPDTNNWPTYEVKFFRHNTFADYLTARKKTKKAETTSDLNSDTEVRKKVPPRRYSSPSSNESSDYRNLPTPPRMSKDYDGDDSSGQLQTGDEGQNVTVIDTQRKKSQEIVTQKSNEACCCCIMHPQFKDMEKLYRKLNIFQQFMVQVSEKIDDLSLQLGNTRNDKAGDDMLSVTNIFDLPFNSTEKLDELESYLLEERNFVATVNEISKMGGKSIYEFIKRSISIFITNELGSQFSWLGRRTKRPFNALKLSEVLIRSAQKSISTVSIKDIEEAISKWLRRCHERDQIQKKKT